MFSLRVCSHETIMTPLSVFASRLHTCFYPYALPCRCTQRDSQA
jgi:hypothetical protein